MEFRFRAGEDRPPSYLPPSIADAYLPPQSPLGISSHHDSTFTMPSSFFPTSSSFSLPQFPSGYLGPNLQRHDPLQNPMMIPVNPMMMMPVREAMRRELEKERIREEIITGEILRKRELEEEVRRELAYEREVVLRRQAQQFSLQGRKHNKEFLNKPPCGGNKTEAAELMNQNKVKEEWFCDLCNVRATSELDLKNGHLQGKKHKAKAKERELLIASETGGGNNIEAEELVIPKVVKMEWSCDLCHVMTPNEQALTEHMYGKKHKAKEEEQLIASKCNECNKIEAAELINPNKVRNEAAELINPNKVKKEWSCALCQVSPPNEQHLNKHLQGKKHKAKEKELLIGRKCDEGNKIEAAELINPNKVKKEWSCAVCLVSHPSEQHLNKHLQGKKHKAKEEALIRASKPAERNRTEAAQLINPNNVKKEWSFTLCQENAPSEHGLTEHLHGKKHKAKEEELLIASKPAFSSTISKKADNSNTLEKQGVTSNEQEKKFEQHVPKEAKEIVNKKSLLPYCEHCKLHCNSESMLASHLRGKKHLSRMRRLNDMLAKVNEESRADLVAKTMEENIKPRGNSNKGPALNKDDKSNKLVNEVMTTSGSKWLQKLQVGQSEQQVPKKQSKAVKKVPVPCELCNVECYGEFMLESHLRGKKHLARMKELEIGKEVSVNHTEDVNAGVTYGRNEESEVDDVNKVVEIIEVKQSIGSRQDEKGVGSGRTSIGSHQDEQEVGSERTRIGNYQDEQEVESERTSIGNHQEEQVVASETMDGVPVPSTEEVADRMEDGARKNFSLGNLTHAIVRFLFIFSVAGY